MCKLYWSEQYQFIDFQLHGAPVLQEFTTFLSLYGNLMLQCTTCDIFHDMYMTQDAQQSLKSYNQDYQKLQEEDQKLRRDDQTLRQEKVTV